MPNLIPFNRATMQRVKMIKDENARQVDIEEAVTLIYNETIDAASKHNDCSYNFMVPRHTPEPTIVSMGGVTFPGPYKEVSHPFYINNMKDILESLRELFPDCTISHTIMAEGSDGKLYDISKLDDNILPLIDRALERSYIVIDWS